MFKQFLHHNLFGFFLPELTCLPHCHQSLSPIRRIICNWKLKILRHYGLNFGRCSTSSTKFALLCWVQQVLWIFSPVSSFTINTRDDRWEKGRIFKEGTKEKESSQCSWLLTGMDLNEEVWHISMSLEAEKFQGYSSMFCFCWKYGVFGKPRISQCCSLLFFTVWNICIEIGNTHEDETYLI